MTETTPPDMRAEYVHRQAWKAGMLAAINVLTAVLSARLVVLVAVAGAIALTVLALQTPDPYRLGALGIYALGVVVPSIWMACTR